MKSVDMRSQFKPKLKTKVIVLVISQTNLLIETNHYLSRLSKRRLLNTETKAASWVINGIDSATLGQLLLS